MWMSKTNTATRGRFPVILGLILVTVGLLVIFSGTFRSREPSKWETMRKNTVDLSIIDMRQFLSYSGPLMTQQKDSNSQGPSEATALQALVKQRNVLAQILNLKQQRIGQMECELLKNDEPSQSGGWCFAQSRDNHVIDEKFADALADFLKGNMVASFGDGPGLYKLLISSTGKVKGYDAYDGAPFTETTSEGRVKFLDLTLPQFGLPLYDWVMSLEVAEHIPEQFEGIYIDNIIRHAREGVVISWGVPGQPGYHHVNNRPQDYVIKVFNALGFIYDEDASLALRGKAEFFWFRNTTKVFRRGGFAEFDNDGLYFT